MKEYRKEAIISFLLGFLILPLLWRRMHISQTVDFTTERPLLKVPFSVFEKEFLKIKWTLRDTSRHSLFTEPYWDSTFHASVLKMNYQGYILTTYGYLKALILKKKTIKRLRREMGNPSRYKYRFQ